MCPTASPQEAAHAALEDSWLDSCKVVVLVLPQWWKDIKSGPGRVGVHLGQYSSEVGMTSIWSAPGSANLESATGLGGCDWKDI